MLNYNIYNSLSSWKQAPIREPIERYVQPVIDSSRYFIQIYTRKKHMNYGVRIYRLHDSYILYDYAAHELP